jgi:hypothetical protein
MGTVGVKDLTEPELRLWQAFPAGERVDFRTGPDDGPQSGARWGRDRTIRAHVIAALVTGASTAQAGSTRGLRLAGARISGPLTLAGAAVDQVTDFEQCLFDAGIDLSEATTRSVRLRGCFLPYLEGRRITLHGEFAVQDCRLERLSLYAARVTEVTVSRTTLANPGHTAFNADLLTVEAAMFCHDMHVEGLVRLPGAHISGYLRIDGSYLANPGGLVLQADGLVVENGLFGRKGHTDQHNPFTALGEVRLDGARVKGGLMMDYARLSNPGAIALTADQIGVEGGMFLRGAAAEGEIRLRSARITGPFSLAEATLSNSDGFALNAERVAVDGGVFCHDGFTSDGEIRLRGVRVTGQFDLGAVPVYTAADRLGAGDLQPSRISGSVDLRHACIGTLRDDPGAWPYQLRFDGLTYDDLAPPLTAGQRLRWLDRTADGFQPQPYEQLASWYRSIGHDQDARRVLLTRQRKRRVGLHPAARFWGAVQDGLVGYGYRPWLAGLWLLGLLTCGTAYFSANHPQPATPHQDIGFNAFGYTLDLILPVVNLGQQSSWNPQGAGQAIAYALIIGGWVLATALVAGITRIIVRG